MESRYALRLRKELLEAFSDPLGPLPISMLSTLPFLNAVLHETLRLTSPFFNPRIVPPGGFRIENKVIPPGTIVALAAHSQQLSPDNFFPEPTVNFQANKSWCIRLNS